MLKQNAEFVAKKDIIKNSLDPAINEYLSFLDEKDRKELKEELYYNVEFKKEFGFHLSEFSKLFACLIYERDDIFAETCNELMNRGGGKNIHIRNMYDYYLNNVGDDLIPQVGENRATVILEQIKSFIEKASLYYDLQESLEPSTSETVVKKSKV